MTAADIIAKNFTILQVIYHIPEPKSKRYPCGWRLEVKYWVVSNPFVMKIRPLIRQMVEAGELGEHINEFHLYPRTYVHRARECLMAGQVIDLPAAG